jgi:tetratricopeptide (TPR) repeat protein
MGHLAEHELALAAQHGDAALSPERRAHLAGCPSCRNALVGAERTEEAPDAGGPTPVQTPAPLRRGSVVGRYLILELLGQGGMGTVYAAYDAELDRKVAVKVLRADSGRARWQEAQLRLLREAQAMARISHPNVLAVHDVGTVEQGVFLAMALVEGGTLKDWLRERPRTPGEILEAFVQAGQGLLAAHRAGLVHRDFKPGNVLVNRDGRVFVTDFGLARLSGGAEAPPLPEPREPASPLDPGARAQQSAVLRSALTQAGTVMGTPRYMSPEQLLGRTPDATSDQFSFCAALFWALCRERPFEPEALARAAEQAELSQRQTAALERGSKIALSPVRELPREVKVPPPVRRAIMRGLSLSPQDRFPSLEPLLAILSPRPQRARWTGIAAAGLLGLTALGALWVQNVRSREALVCSGAPDKLSGAWDPQVRERIRTAFLATSVKDALPRFESVADRLDDYARRWSTAYHDTCAATAIRKEQSEQVLGLRMICLERHVGQLRATTHLLTSADAALERKSLEVVEGLPGFEDCADVQALTQAQVLPQDPTVREQIRGVQSALATAGALKLAGRYGEAERKLAEVIDRAAPLAYAPLTAESLYVQGALFDGLARYDESMKVLRRAFDEADAGKVDTLRVQIASELVYVSNQRSLTDEGLRWAQTARAVLRRVGSRPDLESGLLNNLGDLYLSQARIEDAARAFERALEQVQSLPEPRPAEVATYRMNLAGVYARLSRTREAAELIDQVIAFYEKTFGPGYPALAKAYMVLAENRSAQGEVEAALRANERAITLTRQVHGERFPWLVYVYDTKGTILQTAGRFDEAKDAYLAALEVALHQAEPNVQDLAYTYGGVGQCLVALGRMDEAKGYLEKALAIPLPDALERGNSLFALASALWSRPGARGRARALAAQARAHFERAGAADRSRALEAWLAAHGERPAQP